MSKNCLVFALFIDAVDRKRGTTRDECDLRPMTFVPFLCITSHSLSRARHNFVRVKNVRNHMQYNIVRLDRFQHGALAFSRPTGPKVRPIPHSFHASRSPEIPDFVLQSHSQYPEKFEVVLRHVW